MAIKNIPAQVDVVVVGSGAAALSAALKAASDGLSVVVLEKSPFLGGTSAMSGAGTWIPANHHMRNAGICDSPESALDYLRATAADGWAETEDPLWRAFAEAAPQMLAFVESVTPLQFELIPEPDPFAERAGGTTFGRMLSPKPLSRRVAGKFGKLIRPSTLPHGFSYGDNFRHDIYHQPIRSTLKMLPELIRRFIRDERGQGTALITGLLKGCMDAGCQIFTDASVQSLVREGDSITGVRVSSDGELKQVSARRGVILATGGFEWDADRLNQHFPGGNGLLGSPRSNSGDGHRMAEAVGAKLERMDQANIYPVLPTMYEGQLHGLPITFQATPHCIVVNAQARRFCSEYDFNLGEQLDKRDRDGYQVNAPAWVIGDRRFFQSSPAIRWYSAKSPGWLIKADSICELAEKTGLPTASLMAEVDKWNRFCRDGADADFQRGSSQWERYKSGWEDDQRANPALGSLDCGPFYATRFQRSILGTKGGPRTNECGQVISTTGAVIPGLYCAGVAMANPIGTRAVGPGTTIGPCMTWGYICAQSIAQAEHLQTAWVIQINQRVNSTR
jgi:3-oxosteroid 1-dehydrogenase